MRSPPVGCMRLRPLMVFPTMPIENQPDTTASWGSRLVTDEIIETSAPLCEAATVFHPISRESPVPS